MNDRQVVEAIAPILPKMRRYLQDAHETLINKLGESPEDLDQEIEALLKLYPAPLRPLPVTGIN